METCTNTDDGSRGQEAPVSVKPIYWCFNNLHDLIVGIRDRTVTM